MSWHWHSFWEGLVAGAIGGAAGVVVNHWMMRSRRRRSLDAYRHCLAVQTAVMRGDRLAALTHIVNALTLLENREPITIEQWQQEMELERIEFMEAKLRDPESDDESNASYE